MCCIAALFKLSLLAADDESEWEFVKRIDHIDIYRRSLTGYDIDEFKGVREDRVRLEILGAVLENIPNYVNWIDHLEESRIVAKDDEDHMIIYHRYKAIWPFYDRDCIAEVNIRRDYENGKFIIEINSIDRPLVPPKKRTVRIPLYEGLFVFEYVDREHTQETYMAKLDFGGVIPEWFCNLLSREIPYKTLKGLAEESLRKEYVKSAESSELKRKIEESIENGFLVE